MRCGDQVLHVPGLEMMENGGRIAEDRVLRTFLQRAAGVHLDAPVLQLIVEVTLVLVIVCPREDPVRT